MHTSVGHHDMSKSGEVRVEQYPQFVYVELDGVKMYAGELEDFEILFKQALIQIKKIQVEQQREREMGYVG